MKRFYFYIFILIFSLNFKKVLGQSFSINAGVQLTPPYSVYLSDYVSPTSGKLLVNLTMNDPNPTYNVKLKFIIKGEGITIESRPGITPTPLYLPTGSMEIFSASDLAYYFDPANLNFYGMTREQYIKNGRLPEGIYQFCVQAVEYNTGFALSNTACASAWLILNDPPRWITPQQNERVRYQEPQNILFTWLPLHTGSPNSAFTTEYEFTMVEVWPETRNPNDAINVGQPIFQTTTSNTTLLYGPAETPLIVGRKYACRLRAYDKDGRDLFKNNGYSEVLTFIYGEECKFPTEFKVVTENYSRARITWTASPGNTEYILRYRVKGSQTGVWYEEKTILNSIVINDLKAGTYEFGIKSYCSSMEGSYSLTDTFIVPVRPVDPIECRDNTIPNITNTNELKYSLNPGDIIKVGGFDFRLTEVTGSNGIFSGRGIVYMPFAQTNFGGSFVNIKVNSENQLVDGQILLENASIQVLDQQTYDRITEVLGRMDQAFDAIEPYLANADSIVSGTDGILNGIKNIPDATKDIIQQGKDLIAQGKDYIANGLVDDGKALIDKGKDLIANGLNSIGNGSGSGGSLGDNLKELIVKSLNEIKGIHFDKIKSFEISLKEFNSKRKEAVDENRAKRNSVVVNKSGQSEVSDLIVVNNTSRELKKEDLDALKKDQTFKKYIESKENAIKIERQILESYKVIMNADSLLKETSINQLLSELKDELKKEGKSILEDALAGKDTNIEKRINEFIDRKLQELLLK